MADVVGAFRQGASMTGLSTLEAYERWAPRYAPVPHNPLMAAEQREMLARLPPLTGKTALDLACGSGRYMRLLEQGGTQRVVGMDFSMGMLARATGTLVRGDLISLPFASGAFDVVVSGLALGHAADLARCARECARVLAAGGLFIYSDFHPEGVRAGLKRAFRDSGGMRCELPNGEYRISQHLGALDAAGFTEVELTEIRAGIEFNDSFPGADEFFRAWLGTPLFFIVHARKAGA
jgi:SAM-dependent methyltransferase